MTKVLLMAGLTMLAFGALAKRGYEGPIIDMHMHALPVDFQGPPPQTTCAPFTSFPAWDPDRPYPETFGNLQDQEICGKALSSPMSNDEIMHETLAILDELDIYGVVSGPMELVQRWRNERPERVIPAVMFDVSSESPAPGTVRKWHEDDRIRVLGEVTIQYQGIEPDDSRFEPYLALAEDLGLPVGIHMGPGPPGAPYLGFQNYRARMHSPLSLEEPLSRHPGLRVYVMHAGWPMLDDTLALLYAHPQVYVGIGVISYILPREEFHRYLRRLVIGFGLLTVENESQAVLRADPNGKDKGGEAANACMMNLKLARRFLDQ